MDRRAAERIASATHGGERRYLVPTIGGLRWSAYPESDDNPKHDDFEPGCPVFATPEAAIFSLHAAAGFLVLPGTSGDKEGA